MPQLLKKEVHAMINHVSYHKLEVERKFRMKNECFNFPMYRDPENLLT